MLSPNLWAQIGRSAHLEWGSTWGREWRNTWDKINNLDSKCELWLTEYSPHNELHSLESLRFPEVYLWKISSVIFCSFHIWVEAKYTYTHTLKDTYIHTQTYKHTNLRTEHKSIWGKPFWLLCREKKNIYCINSMEMCMNENVEFLFLFYLLKWFMSQFLKLETL